MISGPSMLQEKLSELLAWEKTKRREQILISLLVYGVSGALLTVPLRFLVPASSSVWWTPFLIAAALAPFLFVKKRWRALDSTRAIAQVDSRLALAERALTASEIVARGARTDAESLVVAQAEQQLGAVEFQALCRRRFHWHAYLVLPLFALWFALLWLDPSVPASKPGGRPAIPTTAYKLRDFSRQLQETAKLEGLRDSLQAGRELEKFAQQRIDAKTGEERFKSELAAMSKKFDATDRAAAAPSMAGAESRESLEDLKNELSAAWDLLKFPGAEATSQAGKNRLDRLESLPQLKRQFDKQGPAGRRWSQSELQSFLDRLDRQVTGELDRRTLLDAQQFVQQLMKEGQGQTGGNQAQMAGREEPDAPDAGEKTKRSSNRPGQEPGRRQDELQPMVQFPGGPATYLKGVLSEGERRSLLLKGKPSPGKSKVAQEEVVTAYRRQAEAELDTERIPEALKETIKNYFLSLGMGEGRR